MEINEFLTFFIILFISLSGIYSKENSENIAESQINEDNLIGDFEIEDKDSRSLISLGNIQNDIWNDRFANGFSCIELEDNRSGVIHLLNNNSKIKLGKDEYAITSSNMPDYDSLIVFVENVRLGLNSNEENNEIKDQNLLIVTNETENEILIKSNRLSNGFVCMGILNGTEIWSREFCENLLDFKINETTCSCKGSFIYSLVDSKDEYRALQSQYNNFNFPGLTNNENTEANHANDAYLSRVSRSYNPNSNHGDKVPFPPLHGSIGGRSSNVNAQKKETSKNSPKNQINFEQNELMQYYHSVPTNKYVINNLDNEHIYDKSRLNELNHKNSINKEINQVNSNLIDKNNSQKTPWNTKNSVSNNNIHTDVSKPKVDSITVNLELKNISFESLNNQNYKRNFESKFINSLSRALNILTNKFRIINTWNEENPALRGTNSRSIGVTVNIITSVPDEVISKVKNLKSQICEFSKIFEFYLISISKNIGSKSISNEIIADRSEEKKKKEITYDGKSLRTLPIIFTMDLRTIKPHINQKEAFALLEDELSRSIKIPKSSIDIPEFTYKQLNDPFTSEEYLVIHTEIWVHPEKQLREEYTTLLTNIYSNIIHNKRSSFSKIFLCNKHEIKEIPHIKAQPTRDEQIFNQNENLQKSSETKTNLNKESRPVDEGRISKIGGFYQINQNSYKNPNNSQTIKSESIGRTPQSLYSQNTSENAQINPVVYLFKQ
ncbi:erythrocyte membrane-associated antigen [Cryptosporidium ubiquitum]|uniref:Erythrocyte membrane-associated antigen n=1 Tax=Cryptosporidium ubiquitum TaxID=857276 RepID=A0A1J4MBP0_9CRYT|nr:erythrocyte membrane-associated antigen [Cryptosporidium ubiquitum]OII70891.1 erythrocyte membrane-associated antigen [Cryptosporidium ubiquitum]